MGMHHPFMISGSSFDFPSRKDFNSKKISRPPPNPDPSNFLIKSHYNNGKYLIILINNPDCTNYEGNKILLFENTTLSNLESQATIDPHFSNNKDKYSPIARFEPTIRGWDMAVKLIDVLLGNKNEFK